jgi:hypothetical protein
LLEEGKRSKLNFEQNNHQKKFRLLLEWRTNGVEFSGWSENYIALNQDNFVLDEGQQIQPGSIVTWTYRFIQ